MWHVFGVDRCGSGLIEIERQGGGEEGERDRLVDDGRLDATGPWGLEITGGKAKGRDYGLYSGTKM